MYNGNQLKVTGKPDGTGNIEINDVTYSSSQVGKLDGEVDFNSFAPYVGLGYSSSKTKKSGFSFNTEIGAMFHGTPSAKLRATCGNITAAECATLQSDLAAEEKQLNDDLKSFNIYPVATVGIGYKF